MEISVREVTSENWEEALALSVWPEQREFVPAVARSLAKCHVRPDGKTYEPFAVYSADELVGFYTLSYNPADATKCYLGGFLIDRAHQRRGLGSAALAQYLTGSRAGPRVRRFTDRPLDNQRPMRSTGRGLRAPGLSGGRTERRCAAI